MSRGALRGGGCPALPVSSARATAGTVATSPGARLDPRGAFDSPAPMLSTYRPRRVRGAIVSRRRVALLLAALAVPGCGSKPEPDGPALRTGGTVLWSGVESYTSAGTNSSWTDDGVSFADLTVDGNAVYVIARVSNPSPTPAVPGIPHTHGFGTRATTDFLVVSTDGGRSFRTAPFPHDTAVTDYADGIHASGGRVVLLTGLFTSGGGIEGPYLREIDVASNTVVANEALDALAGSSTFEAYPAAYGDDVDGYFANGALAYGARYSLSQRTITWNAFTSSELVPTHMMPDRDGRLVGFGRGVAIGGVDRFMEAHITIPDGAPMALSASYGDAAAFPQANPSYWAVRGPTNTWGVLTDSVSTWAYRIPDGGSPIIVALGNGAPSTDYQFHDRFGGLVRLTVQQPHGTPTYRFVDPDGASGPEEVLFPASPFADGVQTASTPVATAPLGGGQWLVVYEGGGLYALRLTPERRPI